MRKTVGKLHRNRQNACADMCGIEMTAAHGCTHTPRKNNMQLNCTAVEGRNAQDCTAEKSLTTDTDCSSRDPDQTLTEVDPQGRVFMERNNPLAVARPMADAGGITLTLHEDGPEDPPSEFQLGGLLSPILDGESEHADAAGADAAGADAAGADAAAADAGADAGVDDEIRDRLTALGTRSRAPSHTSRAGSFSLPATDARPAGYALAYRGALNPPPPPQPQPQPPPLQVPSSRYGQRHSASASSAGRRRSSVESAVGDEPRLAMMNVPADRVTVKFTFSFFAKGFLYNLFFPFSLPFVVAIDGWQAVVNFGLWPPLRMFRAWVFTWVPAALFWFVVLACAFVDFKPGRGGLFRFEFIVTLVYYVSRVVVVGIKHGFTPPLQFAAFLKMDADDALRFQWENQLITGWIAPSNEYVRREMEDAGARNHMDASKYCFKVSSRVLTRLAKCACAVACVHSCPSTQTHKHV